MAVLPNHIIVRQIDVQSVPRKILKILIQPRIRGLEEQFFLIDKPEEQLFFLAKPEEWFFFLGKPEE